MLSLILIAMLKARLGRFRTRLYRHAVAEQRTGRGRRRTGMLRSCLVSRIITWSHQTMSKRSSLSSLFVSKQVLDVEAMHGQDGQVKLDEKQTSPLSSISLLSPTLRVKS